MTDRDDISREEVESTLKVIDVVYENEADSDHESTVLSSRGRLIEVYGGEVGPLDEQVTKTDVQRALDLLKRLAPSSDERDDYTETHDGRHPDRYFEWAFEFVDNEARYTNGCLPEPRSWEIEYRDSESGDVIEQLEMEHADSETTTPLIEETPYDCVRTEWDETMFIVYVTEATPEEDKFSITCWGCDLEEAADTKAEAVEIAQTHEEDYPDHSAGYKVNRD